jgi:NADPH:quinone reductase-like Zn-dependent oxidoreductase
MNSTQIAKQRRWYRRKRYWIPLLFVAIVQALFWTSRPEPMPFRGSGESMRAMVYREYGTADVLKLETIERPLPNENQVLVQVRAAAINPLDWHYMRGTPYLLRWFAGVRRPYDTRIGADVAGVVVAVGERVTQFKPGDEVFGVAADGSFAEYARASENRIALKPANISFEQAAAVPIAAVTALQALREEGRLQPGQSVLVNGASGGVGTFTVQIAKAYGAQVAGVCSTRNVELVRSIGADSVIDYTQQNFTAGDTRYNLIVDNVRSRGVRAAARVMQPNGIYVAVGGGGPDEGNWIGPFAGIFERLVWQPFLSQELTTLYAEITNERLTTLGELMARGKVTPVIDRTYSLEQVADAVRYVETGRARGKVVILVAQSAASATTALPGT